MKNHRKRKSTGKTASVFRAKRQDLGWTVRRLARFLQVDEKTVWRWEHDEADIPHAATIIINLLVRYEKQSDLEKQSEKQLASDQEGMEGEDQDGIVLRRLHRVVTQLVPEGAAE